MADDPDVIFEKINGKPNKKLPTIATVFNKDFKKLPENWNF